LDFAHDETTRFAIDPVGLAMTSIKSVGWRCGWVGLLFGLRLSSHRAFADDWPQWLGPERSAKVKEAVAAIDPVFLPRPAMYIPRQNARRKSRTTTSNATVFQ
jgi:hypothetical protein